MGIFRRKRSEGSGAHEISHGHVVDEAHEERPAPKTLAEGIDEAVHEPAETRLRKGTPDEPGKPEAVNLERDEPVTNAARRRDSF